MIRLTAVLAVLLGLAGAAVTHEAPQPGQAERSSANEPGAQESQEEADAAQEDDPQDDQRLRGPTIEEILADLEKERGARPVGTSPERDPAVNQVNPGTGSLPWLDPQARSAGTKLLLEGTFIFERRGRLARSQMSGEWYFVFDADAQGFSDPPMIMLPCMALQHMERIAELRGDSVVFIVSGEVKVYHGRNYLLPTGYLIDIPRETGLE